MHSQAYNVKYLKALTYVAIILLYLYLPIFEKDCVTFFILPETTVEFFLYHMLILKVPINYFSKRQFVAFLFTGIHCSENDLN